MSGRERRAHLAAADAPPVVVDPDIDEELHELEAVSRDLESHTLSNSSKFP